MCLVKFDAWDFVRGFEVVWVLWAVSLGLSVWLLSRAVVKLRWEDVRRVFREEDGATYTLSYVMLLPFLILLIATVVETSLMLIAKTGTVYAAYAGARTAAVRYSSESKNDALRHTERAARRAFVPFASGVADERRASGAPADQYLRAYKEQVNKQAAEPYLRAKYAYSHRNVMVRVKEPVKFDDDVTVTVRYRYTFLLPGIGRILNDGERNGKFIAWITTKASLQAESPQNDEQRLGIGYASP